MSQHTSHQLPRISVTAVLEDAGKFLLVEERINQDIVYNQPAGHLEAGESLLEAVKREVLEETAFSIRPQAIIGFYLYCKSPQDVTYLRVCFTGQILGYDPLRKLDDEIIQTHWLNRSEILQIKPQWRTPLVISCIDDYLAGKHYPLEMLKTFLPDHTK